MDEINVGDVVTLKSGGPKMTVFLVRDSGAECQWFNDEERVLHGFFLVTSLAKVCAEE